MRGADSLPFELEIPEVLVGFDLLVINHIRGILLTQSEEKLFHQHSLVLVAVISRIARNRTVIECQISDAGMQVTVVYSRQSTGYVTFFCCAILYDFAYLRYHNSTTLTE